MEEPAPGEQASGIRQPGPIAQAYQALLEDRRNTERIVEDFIHELRTPLTSVRAFAEILLGHGPEDPASRREFLSIILTESERMQRLIEELLRQVRACRHSGPPRRNGIRVEELIARSAQAVRGLFMEAEVSLYRSVEENLPRFPGDEDKLLQVLVNLLSNAVKFSPAGASVLVEADILDSLPSGACGPFMHLAVRDRGPGIPEQDLPRIFDRYHTRGHGRGTAAEGTGIGLSICREIVSQHRGWLWAESIYGSGSAFHVALPFHPPVLEPLQQRYRTPHAEPAAPLLC